MSKAYNDLPGSPATPKLAMGMFVSYCVLAFVGVCHHLYANSKPAGTIVNENPRVILARLVFLILQFPVYMVYVAYVYPQACEYKRYETGEGFTADEMDNLKGGEAIQD